MLPERIGPYRIVGLLGEGGMGRVYEALQDPIARRVALKVLRPELSTNRDILERFFNEARAVNLIEHPSLVQVTDFGHTADGTAYITMEFLRGESLRNRLHRFKANDESLPPTLALYYTWQAADALRAAHEKGIVHRDLKPDNLMLVPDPVAPGGDRVKLLDFGIAKLMSGGQKGTTAHALMGTPQYMSPEQCRGAGHVDDRTDVYALGIILYEMLAQRPPFLADEPMGFLGQHLFDNPPPLGQLAPHIPPQITALAHRMLAKDKAARPSMREVQAAVEQLLHKTKGAHVPSRIGLTTVASASMEGAHPVPTTGLLAGQGIGREPQRMRRVMGAFMIGFLAAATVAASWLLLSKPRMSQSTKSGSAASIYQEAPGMQGGPPSQEASSVVAQPAFPQKKLEGTVTADAVPPIEEVQWQIRSVPSGAAVISSSGQELGNTPWVHTQQKAPGLTSVRLRHPGYDDLTLTLERGHDEIRQVSLHPSPPAVSPASRPRPSPVPARTAPSQTPPTHPSPPKVDYVD